MRILLLLLLVCPIISFAQENNSKPFKGANVVVVKYTNSSDTLFSKLIADLTNYGFTVEKKDKELLLITTEEKNIKHVNYKIRITIKNNIAKYSSQFKSIVAVSFGTATIQPTFYKTEYAKAKTNVQWHIFDDILKFISKTEPQEIMFSKE